MRSAKTALSDDVLDKSILGGAIISRMISGCHLGALMYLRYLICQLNEWMPVYLYVPYLSLFSPPLSLSTHARK
ncbi:hypothetical protein F5Y05DRAFT_387849 [Hypoxylon sp. FL0543]|nr:hypothetical protein F5Y05DRAFT_387849 [Hypoxylon sp. FL0543]